MKKTIRVTDDAFARIKESLSDEHKEIVDRAEAEFETLENYLEKKEREHNEEINTDDDFVSDSLQTYYIIRMVTFLESFFRASFIRLIDVYDRDFDLTFEMNLKHLKQLRKELKITNGQIIADSLNFQKFESSDKEYDVYKIFSNVLCVDNVFALMVKKDPQIPKHHKAIVDLLKERHSIVHELRYNTWKHLQLLTTLNAIWHTLIVFNKVVLDIVKPSKLTSKS